MKNLDVIKNNSSLNIKWIIIAIFIMVIFCIYWFGVRPVTVRADCTNNYKQQGFTAPSYCMSSYGYKW